MEYREHITQEGERWDQIAWRHYGDPHAYERIIVANPGAPIAPVLPGGVVLAVPAAEAPALIDDRALPPWKRRRP